MALREVKVKQGWLSGIAGNDPAISVFKGVPYAKPPVGELRWRAPQPPEPWEGIRNAHVFSAKCMQRGQMKGSFYQKEYYPVEEPISEDSLYLNIWTPAESADEKLPVYFWIHGGAFVGGYGYSAHFGGGGEGFGRHGVILVTINYRLGVWGFLANKELSEEAPYKASGNYGLLDMIAALQWVRENIAAFGGDPDNITIGGQSAGSGAVQDLCCSPLTKGMFKRAILESGGGLTLNHEMPKLAEAEGMTDLKAVFGVDTIAEARAIPAEELQARLNSFGMRDGPYMITSPIIDGYVLPKSPREITFAGEAHDVDYLIGHTGDEAIRFIPAKNPEDFEKFLKGTLSLEAAEKLASMCDCKDEDFAKFLRDFSLDQQYASYSIWCETLAKFCSKAPFSYNFTRRPPGDDAGAFHAVELMYVFQTFVRSWRPMTGLDYEISRDMLKYWCNFIKTGDPNGEGLPEWTRYDSKDSKVMEIGDKFGLYRRESGIIDFYEAYIAKSDMLLTR